MNTGARRSRATNSSNVQSLAPRASNGDGKKLGAIDTNGGEKSRSLPERIRVIIAAENRLLREALTRMLGRNSRIEVRNLEWSGGDELKCVRAGVSGYLPQDASGEEVITAVEAVAAGESVCRGRHCGVLFRIHDELYPHCLRQKRRSWLLCATCAMLLR